MEAEEKLEKAKNEVLRKIGRNMLNFQKIEGMLKFLIAHGTFSGSFSELKSNQEKKIESIKKQTMGQLIGQYLESTFSADEKSTEAPEELKEPHISFKFDVECDESYYESKKQALALLVNERNDLIHHRLLKFDSNSIDSCIEIEQYLEQQHERLLPELYELKNMCENLQEIRRIFAEHLNSDVGKKLFMLSGLKQRLVVLLTEIAGKAARNDGWTLLNMAGQHAAKEIAELKEKLGYKTLKAMILATELFDINEEPTDKGGVRVFYRLKTDLAITVQ